MTIKLFTLVEYTFFYNNDNDNTNNSHNRNNNSIIKKKKQHPTYSTSKNHFLSISYSPSHNHLSLILIKTVVVYHYRLNNERGLNTASHLLLLSLSSPQMHF